MYLLVGIDTEGDNQWDAAARANQTFENIYALPRLHALFARHGVRPTYVITHPVATDRPSADLLRTMLAAGDCEIGAHHHAWETPPCTEEDIRRHPYASTLPGVQFEQQLRNLTSAIEDAVGVRPVSYRSGRFGFSADHVSALERAGYLVESSVAPLFYEAHKGGPDFVEVPVSAALNRKLPKFAQHAYARAPSPYTTKRVLRALRLLRVRWLRPSWSSAEDMIRLAKDLARWDEPVLNLLFHSSEAIVGGSPYNKTQAELDAFTQRLERFLAFATKELGATPVTFAEFRTRYC